MADQTLNIVIVGGSISGLMLGIALRSLGHDVKILESNSLGAQRNLGAGIAAMDDVHTFMERYDVTKTPYTVTSRNVQFLDSNLEVKSKWDTAVKMTSWNCLYYLLRANFDGLSSDNCPKPPNTVAMAGNAVYEHGEQVTGVEYIDGMVTVTFEDNEAKSSRSIYADLVIAADGTSSKIRQLLEPALQRKYVGYVAWRGTAPENEVSEATAEVFTSKTTLFPLTQSYVAVYTIPGDDGDLSPGHRQLNWIWYMLCPENSQDFIDMMTDIDGHRHRNTLPRGKINPEKWKQQKLLAENTLPAPFVEMMQKTTEPFISAISDFDIGKPSYFDGKLLFVGDALATFRPHVASSTHQAAVNARLVEGLVRGEMDMSEWEDKVLSFAYVTALRSKVWGAYFMHGLWTSTFFFAAIQYGVALMAQLFPRRLFRGA